MKASSIAGVVLGFCFLGCGSSSPEAGGSSGGGPSRSGTSTSSAGAASGGSGAQSGNGGSASPSSSAGSGASAGDSNGGAVNGGAANGGAGDTGGAAAMGGSSSAASGAGGSGGGQAITTPAGYKLVWHDEFDIDGAPDPKNWRFEKGFVRNEEAQWYQAANASVQGGLLVIEARKETVQNPNYTGSGDWKTTRKTADYTSSSINTSGLQSFQYGHFELRARIPTDAGMWPAWWTLGVSGEWPSNGEIDIMEYYQAKVLANVACGTATRYQAKWDSASQQLGALGGAAFTSQFHVWTMDWDDQNIVLSLDGMVINTTALSAALNADGTSPFRQKDYILLNLALGGQNGGDPSKTTFPQRYEVDYVRVFQKQ
jgi:beta-glucanase (GH16 family)